MGDAPLTIPELVRSTCAVVSGRATLARVDPQGVSRLADRLAAEPPADPLTPGGAADPWLVGPAPPEATAATVLTLAAINFGSGYHPYVHKAPGSSGARTMAAAVRRWIDAEGPPTAERLATFGREEARVVFGQPHDDGPVDELMGLFADALNQLGRLVAERYDHRFVALVDAAGDSAAALVASLDELAFFHDVATHHGEPVWFHKRAQLAAADLARSFAGTGRARFVDVDRLTAFADNLVPHVLRVDGAINYVPDLAATIDAGEPLLAGEPAEVEIRAAGVTAVEALSTALAERGVERAPHELDMVLWVEGAAPRYKAIPRHRARCVYY